MLSAIRESKKNEGGFTLIELLVVVIIIGLLAAIAIPVFLAQRERAWVSAVESDLRNAAVAMETYYTDNGVYDAAGLDAAFGFVETENVTIGFTGGGQDFCLTGNHDNLTESPVAVYDAGAGGVNRGGECL